MFIVSEGQPVVFSTIYPKQHHQSVIDFQLMHNRQWKVVTEVVYFSISLRSKPPELILSPVLLNCVSHKRFSSTINPRDFVCVTLFMLWLLNTRLSRRLGCLALSGRPIIINLVFEGWN